MRTRIYKLYATGTATTNALANLIIQRPALITAVSWVVAVSAGTVGNRVELELSFASTGQLATNDTIGPISGHNVSALLTTSGVEQGSSFCHSGLAIPASQGDRLYLHCTVGGTITFVVNCYVAAAE